MSLLGGPPPQDLIPPPLLGEYLRLMGIWANSAAGGAGANSATAQKALQDLWQLTAQNQVVLRTTVQSFSQFMAPALTAAGAAYTEITAIMASIGAFISGLIAASGPILLLIIAVLLLTMLYMFLNEWWYQNVTVPRVMQEKSRASSVLMNGGFLSPMYTVNTRQLPPGMYVHGLG